MSAVSAKQVTTTSNDIAGSISADEAVARVNELDWLQTGKNLDEQGSALLPRVLSARECETLAALYPEDSLSPSRVVMGRMASDAASINTSATHCPSDSRYAYRSVLQARSSCESLERDHGDRRPLPGESPGCCSAVPRCRTAAADAFAPPVRRGRFQLSASGSLWGARLSDTSSSPAFRNPREI